MPSHNTNRGTNSNSIVIYSIDQTTGNISLVGHQNTPGATPRSFGLDPTGTFLVAGSQDSGTLVSFRVDPSAGTLTSLGTMTLPATTTWVGMVEVP